MWNLLFFITFISTVHNNAFAKAKEQKKDNSPPPLSKENITAEMKAKTEFSRGSKTTKNGFKISSVEKDDYSQLVVKSTVQLENGETCKVQGHEIQAPPVPGEKDQKKTLQMVSVKTECSSPKKK